MTKQTAAQKILMSEAINMAIDAALEQKVSDQAPRNYLGGSRLGLPCQRALWFEWDQTKQNLALLRDGKPPMRTKFKGKVIRRFEMGHAHEDITARWLQAAGFDLQTIRDDGQQFAFGDPDYPISGHLDGALVDGPVTLPYPLLWEHKIAKAKKATEFAAKGLEVWNPTYWGQVHVYMGWTALEHVLFTVLNTDTSELIFELVRYDEKVARRCLTRGKEVIDAEHPTNVPRIATSPDQFECKWCDHKEACWAVKSTPPVATGVAALAEKPAWIR